MSEICTICGAPCGSPAELLAHMKAVHKGADPAADVEMNPEAHTAGFLCGLCGRRFRTAEALAEHNLHPRPGEHAAPELQPAESQ
jgi:C2H2-type zinc finger